MRFVADDWGISPGVNRGILALIESKVVESVSVMPNAQWFRSDLQALIEMKPLFTFHLDLTHVKQRSVAEIAWLSSTSRSFRNEIREETRNQLSAMRDTCGKVNALESHHNVHLLPGVLFSIIDLLKDSGITHVRTIPDFSNPAGFVGTCTATAYLRRLELCDLPTHSLRPKHSRSEAAFRSFLSKNHDARISCHPAITDDFDELGIVDSWRNRSREYQLLVQATR